MKKFFSLYALAMFLLLPSVFAQYNLLYQNNEQVEKLSTAVAADAQGNSILAGNFRSALQLGSFALTNTGYSGAYSGPALNDNGAGFIGKFDPASNNWLWAKSIRHAATGFTLSGISDMAVDNGGNIYITGHYAGTVYFDNISLTSLKFGTNSPADMFVAKLDGNGNFLWAKSFGTKEGSDRGNAIKTGSDNNIYVTGYFTNQTKTCRSWGTSMESWDIYVAKLNSSGTAIWTNRFANSDNSGCGNGGAGNDLGLDGSGNIYLTGYFKGKISFSKTLSVSSSADNYFITKINNSGTTQWVRNGAGRGMSILVENTGEVYTGTGNSILKHAATGTLSWAVNNTAAEGSLTKVFKHPSGNAGAITLHGVDRTFTIKQVSTSGAVIGSETSTSALNVSEPFDVAATASGFVFNANIEGHAEFGGVTLSPATPDVSSDYIFDMYLVNYTLPSPVIARTATLSTTSITQQTTVSIKEINKTSDITGMQLGLYPNPARNQIKVQINNNKQLGTLTIYNATGKIIYKKLADNSQILIDVQHLLPGVYILKSDQLPAMIKFVKD